ncbi:MAG: ABC transporter substrate-binding protein [Roseburia sp.]|nr:ABC transporter substrate-binding protein [Roseburia sp.]
MKKRLISLLLAMVLMMTALSGCAGGTDMSSEDTSTEFGADTAPTGEPTYGGSVVVGIQQDIDSLDPHKATAAGTKEILFNIFEGLVKPDENGNLINAVASDYTISEDGLTYTFTLRDGVKFHNGNLVTAEDVKYSLERVSGLLNGEVLISTMSTITSVTISDDKTVLVTVDSPNPELIYSFTAAIIPAGSGEAEDAAPIGTGPFSFVSYAPQEGIVLAKHTEYWQEGLPYLDEVTFKIVSNVDTAMLDIKGGSVDICPYLTVSQANELKGEFQIVSAASSVVQALFLNCAEGPLTDAKVRQAICYALDKDMVNEFVNGGYGTIISSAMLPGLKDYYVDLNDVYGKTANIDKAKALLTEAGYPDGIDLEITVPSNYDVHVETTEVIAEQLGQAGINVTINAVEWGVWLDETYNGRQYEATVCGITSDITPGYLLNRFVSDSSKNFINYNSALYDETYAKVVSAKTLEERAGYYKELQQILCEDAATAFIEVPPITIAINPELGGYKMYPIYVQDMSTVYYIAQ